MEYSGAEPAEPMAVAMTRVDGLEEKLSSPQWMCDVVVPSPLAESEHPGVV